MRPLPFPNTKRFGATGTGEIENFLYVRQARVQKKKQKKHYNFLRANGQFCLRGGQKCCKLRILSALFLRLVLIPSQG